MKNNKKTHTQDAETELYEEAKRYRRNEYKIDAMILNRWSPRSMSGGKLTDSELLPLFEAARWAPSSFNAQPWRFLYAKSQNKQKFDLFLSFANERNKIWAKKAAVLVLLMSRNNFEYNEKPSRTHSFDAGAAWQNLALEGAKRGLVVHAYEGFDYELAKKKLKISDEYQIECMIAIGKFAKREKLSDEKMREMEFPSQRKKLSEIAIKWKK